MLEITLGIGHLGATNTPLSGLKTYALGSCVAVILLCPDTKGVGMVHIALSDSSINRAKATELPGYFADTGLPALLQKMATVNGNKKNIRMFAKLAGGASMIGSSDTFNIGPRNILQVKSLLTAARIPLVAEDTGGTYSRTVSVSVDTGEVELSSPGQPNWKI